MSDIEHISVPWLERKVLDALDQIEGRVDNIQDRLAEVELKLEAVFRAFEQNNAIHQETRDKINVLIDRI